jgi:hypothetical protein
MTSVRDSPFRSALAFAASQSSVGTLTDRGGVWVSFMLPSVHECQYTCQYDLRTVY